MASASLKVRAERLLKRIAGAGERMRDEKTDQRDVEARYISEINRMAKLGLFENMKLDHKGVGSCYITTFKDVEVKFDADMDLAYAQAPASHIELPHGKGVDHISPMRSRATQFIPVDANHGFRSAYSPAAGLQGMVGYWIEGDRYYFTRDILTVDEIEHLLIRLVIVDASVIDRDAPLQIDPATETEIEDRVYEYFIVPEKTGTDNTNDGISNKK